MLCCGLGVWGVGLRVGWDVLWGGGAPTGGWDGGLQCPSVGDDGSCCWGPKGGGPIGAGVT